MKKRKKKKANGNDISFCEEVIEHKKEVMKLKTFFFFSIFAWHKVKSMILS